MQAPADETTWTRLEREFLPFHRQPLNVTLHLLTTPLGLFGAFGLLAVLGPLVALGAAALYLGSLLRSVPRWLWWGTAAMVTALAVLAVALEPSWKLSLGLMATGYWAQDWAHRLTGERTFQSTYEREAGALRNLALHSYMLVPLVLAAVARTEVIREWLPRVRVVDGHLDSDAGRADLELIRTWVANQEPSRTHTTHWWFQDTPPEVEAALERLAHDPGLMQRFRAAHPGKAVEVVAEMNEIYVAAQNPQRSSDTVFYTPHIDGPFAIWPGATVYRGLLAVTENTRVQTRFLHPTVHAEPLAYTLTSADFLAFDFNREPHFICDLAGCEDPEARCVLKLHYLVYPEPLPRYGRMLGRATGIYDRWARDLFLATLTPKGLIPKLKTNLVLATTNLFFFVVIRLGWSNLAYLALLGLAAGLSGSLLPMLIGASFVHYLLYLAVFHYREGIDFGRFKRDALLFRTVAHAQLLGLWSFTALTSGFSWLSLGLILGGYGLASAATVALGLDRTYFGVELGQVEPKRITRFPYSFMREPMIIGTLVALLGYQLQIGELVGWLVPIHIGFYALHLAQELADRRERAAS